jgi:glycosyltransferase involved in cell wall biosynthesis
VSGKKLLFVDNNPDFIISHRLPVVLGAKNAGFDVHVAAPMKSSAERIRELGAAFHPIKLDRKGVNPFQEISTIHALYRLYRGLKPDLVHHISVKPVAYGGIAARLAGVPAVVNSLTGLGYVFIGKGVKAAFLRAVVLNLFRVAYGHGRTVATFQNPDDERELVGRGIVAKADSALIRGSGVDMRVFKPSSEAQGPPVVVFPSRLLWDKGTEEFVTAARMLRERGVVARFVLVGRIDEGNPAGIPRSQIEDWASEGSVEWWGHRDDMPAVFADSHVVCLPSYREGFPKALIEAAACSRAIVATDVPGCREVVENGVNGFLVPAQDAVALADALERILSDPEARAAMGRAGREKVEKTLAVETVVDATLALYRKLLA